MLVEALKDFTTTSHTLKKGDVANIRYEDAKKLIEAKKAKVSKAKKGK